MNQKVNSNMSRFGNSTECDICRSAPTAYFQEKDKFLCKDCAKEKTLVDERRSNLEPVDDPLKDDPWKGTENPKIRKIAEDVNQEIFDGRIPLKLIQFRAIGGRSRTGGKFNWRTRANPGEEVKTKIIVDGDKDEIGQMVDLRHELLHAYQFYVMQIWPRETGDEFQKFGVTQNNSKHSQEWKTKARQEVAHKVRGKQNE